MNKREQLNINKKHEAKGVEFVDIDTVYIDKNVKIGKGTKLYPSVVLEGNTVLGENCNIGMGSHIKDSCVGDRVFNRSFRCKREPNRRRYFHRSLCLFKTRIRYRRKL